MEIVFVGFSLFGWSENRLYERVYVCVGNENGWGKLIFHLVAHAPWRCESEIDGKISNGERF